MQRVIIPATLGNRDLDHKKIVDSFANAAIEFKPERIYEGDLPCQETKSITHNGILIAEQQVGRPHSVLVAEFDDANYDENNSVDRITDAHLMYSQIRDENPSLRTEKTCMVSGIMDSEETVDLQEIGFRLIDLNALRLG